MPSHPAWVCGLKLIPTGFGVIQLQSHPAWVCGLKPSLALNNSPSAPSHPAWVCGLKQIKWLLSLALSRHTLRGCVD